MIVGSFSVGIALPCELHPSWTDEERCRVNHGEWMTQVKERTMQTQQRPVDIVRRQLADQPRVRLADLPTPLQLLPNLSDQLGIQLWVKRDDQTGLALGGNKVRKLEYLMAEGLRRRADTIITTGASQSNHARMTAAASRRLGLDCYLVLSKGRYLENGNALLDELLGARVESVESSELAPARMEALAEELRAGGRQPYIVPLGGSVPMGATGYVQAMVELAEQLNEQQVHADDLYLVSGSCGTQAGVLVGVAALELPLRVHGISVSEPRATLEERTLELAQETADHLGLDIHIGRDLVHVDDRYVGEAYGHPTAAMWEALKTVARTEGILLDPVYTGKAMAGLLDHARRGIIPRDATVIFLHTGGLPALFAYSDEVRQAL
jgi:L-cysteate sulfo-lyase